LTTLSRFVLTLLTLKLRNVASKNITVCWTKTTKSMQENYFLHTLYIVSAFKQYALCRKTENNAQNKPEKNRIITPCIRSSKFNIFTRRNANKDNNCVEDVWTTIQQICFRKY